MKLVLEVAHEKTVEQDKNFPDPGMLVGDSRLLARNVTKDEIRHILEAVAVTTGMVVIRDKSNYEFSITAPVETILSAMTQAAAETLPAGTKTGESNATPPAKHPAIDQKHIAKKAQA